MKTLKYLIPILLFIFAIVVACGTWNVNGDKPNTDNQRTDPPATVPGVPGNNGTDGVNGKDGQSCTLDSDTGVLTCGTVKYQTKGAKGDKGDDGTSMVFQMIDASPTQCPAGGYVLLMAYDTDEDGLLTLADGNVRSATVCNGVKGDQGTQGIAGQTGAKGDKGDQGVQGIQGNQGTQGDQGIAGQTGAKGDKGDQGVAGVQGDQGQQGDKGDTGATGAKGDKGDTGATGATGQTSQFQVTSMIAACGANSSPWKEVLLCLADGTLVASFSNNVNGDYTRLAIIPPGSYMNTDSSGCTFTVTSSGSGNAVSWGAGSNSYSSWVAGQAYCGH